MSRDKIIENVFREYYVPLYPKDKPISEMTPYEQGLYKETLTLGNKILNALYKPQIDEGKLKNIGIEWLNSHNKNCAKLPKCKLGFNCIGHICELGIEDLAQVLIYRKSEWLG